MYKVGPQILKGERKESVITFAKIVSLRSEHTFHEEQESHLLRNQATNLVQLLLHLFAKLLRLGPRCNHCSVDSQLGRNYALYI